MLRPRLTDRWADRGVPESDLRAELDRLADRLGEVRTGLVVQERALKDAEAAEEEQVQAVTTAEFTGGVQFDQADRERQKLVRRAVAIRAVVAFNQMRCASASSSAESSRVACRWAMTKRAAVAAAVANATKLT
jgi:hypothetical protein